VKQDGTELTEETGYVWTENDKVNPYAKYKAVAETLVFRANGPSLRTISIRVPGIYGEGHCAIIDQPITSMRKGQQNIQLGNNSKLFTFTYVGNAAHAHVLASHALLAVDDKTQTPKVDGEAFFVSDGVSKPFWDTCREILHEAGDRSPRQKIKVLPLLPMIIIAGVGEWLYWTFTLGTKAPAMRKMDIEFLAQGQVFSIDKAKARLHYEPLVTQQEGIRRAVEWALEHEENVA